MSVNSPSTNGTMMMPTYDGADFYIPPYHNVGLLLKHGDLMGAYYTGPHGHIKAERSQMLTSEYKKLLRKQSSEAIGDEDYYPSTCLPLLDSIAEEVLTLDGLSIN